MLRDRMAAVGGRGGGTYRHDYTTNAGPFYDAAWTLCRQGVLRPAAVAPGLNGAPPAAAALYAVTAYGLAWLARAPGSDVLPSEYGRFSELLAERARRFGAAYRARAQEAIRCYRAQTYLACCAMCGAAAESVALALAVARSGDAAAVRQEYRTSSGRTKIERRLLAQQNPHVQTELTTFLGLLKYWRDDAAHGADVEIGETEAFTSLLLLLRFAQFADDRWEDLVAPAGQSPGQVGGGDAPA